ncbi:hypothetical protein M0R45_017174 [Rubus argutus]|uniref:Uncharacterized protein n=1 Tax=Rubus argutus TaxID=59490 RepID=A0AAW1XY99_RUBAR
MGRTKEVARLTTGDISPPSKRLSTDPHAVRNWPKGPVLDNPSSSSESEMSQDEEASSESQMMPQEKEANSEPEMSQDEEVSSESEMMPQDEEASSESEMMPQDEEASALNGSGSPAPVDLYEATVREVSWDEYDQALKERFALNELKNNLRAELKEVQNDRSKAWAEFELGKKVWEAEKKALTERLDKEFNNFAAGLKEVLKNLSKSEAELEQTSQERDSYRNSLELGKEMWEAEKKSLTDRLNNQFNVFGAELKEVLKNLSKSEAELKQTSQERDSYQNTLELGNKVWEAERIEMVKKITKVNKEKENAYCKGYLDGWFKKPHAYVHAWHDAKLADEVTDHPVLQMMSKLQLQIISVEATCHAPTY